MKINWTITDQNVVVNYDGETHIVKRTDDLSDKLIKALKENRQKDIPILISTAKRIEQFSHGNFIVENGQVLINGVVAPEVLGNKIVQFSNEGLPFQPLLRFAEKLQENPSFRAVNELYQFLENNDHPITETGNFIAYKRVRSDYKDIYSGKFDNSVGSVLKIPRNQVDEDSERTCSNGLHVANWQYAHETYGSSQKETDILLEVEVNPAHVVAVPSDYSHAKIRVCEYKVLGVITNPLQNSSIRITDQEEFNRLENTCVEDDYCHRDRHDICNEDNYDNDLEDEYPYEDEME